jgi:hypothetical protein
MVEEAGSGHRLFAQLNPRHVLRTLERGPEGAKLTHSETHEAVDRCDPRQFSRVRLTPAPLRFHPRLYSASAWLEQFASLTTTWESA